jgi:predicted RND superfamily exporter protein
MAGICLALLILVGWGAAYINTSVRPARFFDENHRMLSDYRWLAAKDRFGPQIPIELVVVFDSDKTSLNTLRQLQLVSDLQQDLKASRADLIGSTISAATFAPSLDVARSLRFKTNERLAENRQAYNDVHYYSSKKSDTGGLQELWRISTRVESKDLDYDEVIRQIEDHVKDFLARRREGYQKDRELAKASHDKRMEKARQVLADNEQRFQDDQERLKQLRQQYGDYVDFAEKQFASTMAALSDDTDGVDLIYTGMVPLFHEAQNELLNGLFKSFLLAFVLIAIVMIVWFRSLRAGLLTMFPNVFPAAMIFGYMGWRGMIVDIGSMMTASVAMGIAVDDTVHYLTWFRRGLRDGMSRRDALIEAYQRCARAMTQTTMIAGLSLLVLVLSSFQPVSQFGLLMFVLLVAALVGDLVFLPALLAGRAGELFRPTPGTETELPAEQPVA